MTVLEELAQIARTRPEKLKALKSEGIRLVGYTGRFVPEELVYASGAVPYLLCRGATRRRLMPPSPICSDS